MVTEQIDRGDVREQCVGAAHERCGRRVSTNSGSSGWLTHAAADELQGQRHSTRPPPPASSASSPPRREAASERAAEQLKLRDRERACRANASILGNEQRRSGQRGAQEARRAKRGNARGVSHALPLRGRSRWERRGTAGRSLGRSLGLKRTTTATPVLLRQKYVKKAWIERLLRARAGGGPPMVSVGGTQARVQKC